MAEWKRGFHVRVFVIPAVAIDLPLRIVGLVRVRTGWHARVLFGGHSLFIGYLRERHRGLGLWRTYTEIQLVSLEHAQLQA
jgi:hypothetical protein